jgi:hypothetical protein
MKPNMGSLHRICYGAGGVALLGWAFMGAPVATLPLAGGVILLIEAAGGW